MRHALLEGIARMLRRIVIMCIGLRHLGVSAIEGLLRIIALVAIMMVRHVRAHIRLIVVQIDGFRLLVVTGPITIVIRRGPSGISRTTEHIPQRRTLDEYRTHDIVRSVQPAVADHLHIQGVRAMLRDEGRYILIERMTETCLNEESMVHTAMGLNHTQIVDPAVTIEVEVVDHIIARVQDTLELRYVTCLSKSRSYGVKVEVEREVGIEIGDRHRGNRRMLGRRSGDCRRIDGFYRHNDCIRRSDREDRGPTARQTYCRKHQ